jgi:hypothetical protein
MLVTIDVMAFGAAAWLMLSAPEAFAAAAHGANLGAIVFAGSTAIAPAR